MTTNPAPNAYATAWSKALFDGRERKGLTRRELADLLEVHYQAVQHWETGRAQPSARNQAKLYGIGIVTAEELSAITLKAAHDPRSAA